MRLLQSMHKTQLTAACTNAQGWTTLGDIGRLDEEGRAEPSRWRRRFRAVRGIGGSPPLSSGRLTAGEVDRPLGESLNRPARRDAAVTGNPDPTAADQPEGSGHQ